MIKYLLSAMVLLGTCSAMAQTLSVAQVFSDDMVLQRQQVINVWGKGPAGENVTVTLNKQRHSGVVSENGRWRIAVDKMSAGGPYRMHIASANESLNIDNVLVGDVWLASGQSNMEWKLDWETTNWQQEKADAEYPDIRFFNMNTDVKVRPSREIKSKGWQQASRENVGDFSAVAWFFAKQYHLNKNIPIGIIESNVGGTPAEAWTPMPTLLNFDSYKQQITDMLENPSAWQQRIKQRGINEQQKWQLINDSHAIDTLGLHLSDYDDSRWNQIYVPFKNTLTDIVWLRKSINLTDESLLQLSAADATLFFGDINQGGKIFVNGLLVANEGWQDQTQIITLPKKLLKKGKNTIALRVVNTWDNRVKVGNTDEVWLSLGAEKISLAGKWRYANNIEQKMPEVERISSWPAGLYNAMINPLTGLSMKGVIWYQGESNVGRAQEYQTLFPSMITSWRESWGIGDFPFLFVQLASFLPQKATPSDSNWAELREAQTKTLSLKNTGMAVTIDIGDAEDIHPRNKKEVGRRLWLAAQSVADNNTKPYFGPAFAKTKINDQQLTVQFTTQSALKVKGTALLGFELAGLNGVYYHAKAQVISANTIVLSSPAVSEPKAIRYAWADNSPANLYDGEGLPAIPFRYGEQLMSKNSK
ncbi:sialate O-acetylesterase [Thalassotalea sp. PLHSN55]|uniref:sialate O-acetylesterase n=1 Tax=Thalassotalea sp. PLHSN55 TaxID=3435888 RepID=UPI003F82F633